MKVIIPEAETEGTFEGWVRVETKNAISIYRKMLLRQRRENEARTPQYPYSLGSHMKASMLLHLTPEQRSSQWIRLPLGKAEKIMELHCEVIKYRNCVMKPFFYMQTHRHSISVWPQHERDETLNRDNNWGEEE